MTDIPTIIPVNRWGEVMTATTQPMMRALCDGPEHRVWEHNNFGRWNEMHKQPSYQTYFDVVLHGKTQHGVFFSDQMKVMLDRRPAYQEIGQFKAWGDRQKKMDKTRKLMGNRFRRYAEKLKRRRYLLPKHHKVKDSRVDFLGSA